MASELVCKALEQIKQDVEEDTLLELTDLLRYIPEWKLKEFLQEANR